MDYNKPRIRLLRLRDVVERTGLSRSTIYKMIHEGRFPKQIQISERRIGWDEDEIAEWMLALCKAAGRTAFM